ncbi:type III-B CRISPR module RAMP protein Cmr1 [Chloroflexus sp.]|uniref:type III-B CRISPR module RAMP protein Cmr1 n=1 Tax=Chloroflexus sp. TaxID=1904827 RepID=UPI00298F119C|nr:type III-B CRISPR module RAMP protein Cmr1 [Chloroflexus sp.]MDW8405063.1 type III-B CRISPR module RAMP protein Cmr1 [Chloroflexus sp.]
MTRPLPELSVPILQTKPDAPITHIRFYRVITPLFGGGVAPQQADPITTVRASEIRGQLRFWWRATQAGRYGKNGLQQMKRDEDALWGSTSTPSQVQIEVRKSDEGIIIHRIKVRGKDLFWGDPESPISYGAFPLRKIEGNEPPGGLRFGVTFELAVTLPRDQKLREQVLAAFWAWETFGGIGARTRRGFGALYCEKVEGDANVGPWHPPKADKATVDQWLHEQLQQFVAQGNAPDGVPTLLSEYRIAVNSTLQSKAKLDEALKGASSKYQEWLPALIAWYYPIEKMQQFRQCRRNKGQTYGRSYWPEPDEIRRRTTGFKGTHQELSKTRKFPRAVFGLPIVFQFKDKTIDPPQTTLQGARHDRLASRLILRPLRCADGKFVSMALVLNAPALPPDGLKLVGANGGQGTGIDTEPLTKAEANFLPLNGNTDVLKAFLDTL